MPRPVARRRRSGGLGCKDSYEASSASTCTAGFQAPRLPTVRGRTSAGRRRAGRRLGRPSGRAWPRRPASAPTPPWAPGAVSLSPAEPGLGASRDPHPELRKPRLRPGAAALAETWPREGRGAALRRPRPPGNSPRALPPFRSGDRPPLASRRPWPELLRPQGWAPAHSQAAVGGLQKESLRLFPAFKRGFLTCRTNSDRRLDN